MIRRAIHSDIPSLVELNARVLADHENYFRTLFKMEDRTDNLDAMFASILQGSSHLVFVSEEQGFLRGYLYAEEIRGDECHLQPERHYLLMHHMCVEKNFQGHGIGRDLVESIRVESARRGIKRIVLDVWSFNESAVAFFTKCGFEIANLRMSLERK